jgi:hypothetical protein
MTCGIPEQSLERRRRPMKIKNKRTWSEIDSFARLDDINCFIPVAKMYEDVRRHRADCIDQRMEVALAVGVKNYATFVRRLSGAYES